MAICGEDNITNKIIQKYVKTAHSRYRDDVLNSLFHQEHGNIMTVYKKHNIDRTIKNTLLETRIYKTDIESKFFGSASNIPESTPSQFSPWCNFAEYANSRDPAKHLPDHTGSRQWQTWTAGNGPPYFKEPPPHCDLTNADKIYIGQSGKIGCGIM